MAHYPSDLNERIARVETQMEAISSHVMDIKGGLHEIQKDMRSVSEQFHFSRGKTTGMIATLTMCGALVGGVASKVWEKVLGS